MRCQLIDLIDGAETARAFLGRARLNKTDKKCRRRSGRLCWCALRLFVRVGARIWFVLRLEPFATSCSDRFAPLFMRALARFGVYLSLQRLLCKPLLGRFRRNDTWNGPEMIRRLMNESVKQTHRSAQEGGINESKRAVRRRSPRKR